MYIYRGSRRPNRLDCMAIYANEIGVLRLHSYFERTLISSEDFTLAPFTYSASLMQHAFE